MLGVCSECLVLGNANVKIQFECRVYYANKNETPKVLGNTCVKCSLSVALTTRKYDVARSARKMLGIKMGCIM